MCQCGTQLTCLPPYSLDLNPIEVCFGQLKRWIQKNTNIVFPLHQEKVLEVTMSACTKDMDSSALGLHGHCGCNNGGLLLHFFEALQNIRND